MTYAVTGATGHLGGLIIQALLNRGVAPEEIIAVVRNEAKASNLSEQGIKIAVASYEHQDALIAGLQGVAKLVMVSGSEVGKRAEQHTNIINAAKAAGVELIAYTSLLNLETSQLSLAAEHRVTEKLLSESGIDTVLLRNGWYWENYASNVESAKATGKFFGAAGEAKVSGAARRDYAEAAAVVITSKGHAGKTYELAGSPSLNYPEIAAGIGEALNASVEYVNQSVDEYAALLESAGLPAEVAGMLAGWEPIIEDGALYSESTDLQDLIGRESTGIVDTLKS